MLDDAGDGSTTSARTAGHLSVSETFGDGSAIGSDWTVVFSGDCDPNGGVALAYGDAKTCTLTNKRKPKLTVVKVIEGGNGAPSTSPSTARRCSTTSAAPAARSRTPTRSGRATASPETLGDGDAVDPAVWAAGEHKTCTVTNKRKPKLTVVKVIEGGNGAAFDLAVNRDGSTTSARRPGHQHHYEGSATPSPRRSATATRSTRRESSTAVPTARTLAAGEHKTCTVITSASRS